MHNLTQFPNEDEQHRIEQDEEREWFYQEWCRERGHDPEDTESAILYEEWYAWENSVPFFTTD